MKIFDLWVAAVVGLGQYPVALYVQGIERLSLGVKQRRRHIANSSTANALVPDTLTDLGGGACFNDARVQVERA